MEPSAVSASRRRAGERRRRTWWRSLANALQPLSPSARSTPSVSFSRGLTRPPFARQRAPRMDTDPLLEATRRCAEARRATPDDARLLAYDVNGIQEYVTANSRPRAMDGASRVIAGFDETHRAAPGALFCGGGRGLFLVSERDAERRARKLADDFREASIVGVIATAHVPFDPSAEHASLRHLQAAIDEAKDAADAPVDPVPASKELCCERCRRYARVDVRRAGERHEHLCARCCAVTDRGLKERTERGFSLVDLVKEGDVARGNHVAAISADGNDMGVLFASLPSLEATVAVSLAVAQTFAAAHLAALGECKCGELHVAPVTGGDDIRVFLAPWRAPTYVATLAAEVERGLTAAAAKLAHLLPDPAKLAQTGIGIGVVAADMKSPASRMIERAHGFERAAKSLCREKGARSAVAFAWDTGDEGFNARAHGRGDGSVVVLGEPWQRARMRAESLAEVPTSQLAIVAERPSMAPDEFANLFRYQVARSEAWQRWYDAIGASWRDRDAVVALAPTMADLTLLRFVRAPEVR
ncbi:MAG: hypothetical protein U0324_46025 [Polyangiales bacterium]